MHARVAEGRSQAQGWRPQAGGRGTGAPKEPIPWRTLWGCSQGPGEDRERCEPHGGAQRRLPRRFHIQSLVCSVIPQLFISPLIGARPCAVYPVDRVVSKTNVAPALNHRTENIVIKCESANSKYKGVSFKLADSLGSDISARVKGRVGVSRE